MGLDRSSFLVPPSMLQSSDGAQGQGAQSMQQGKGYVSFTMGVAQKVSQGGKTSQISPTLMTGSPGSPRHQANLVPMFTV